MVLPRETIKLGASPQCPDCKIHVDLAICHSPAGFYIGTYCNCGPYSRESGYYKTESEAQKALDKGDYHRQ